MKKIPNIGKKNILVIGDIMLDTYYRGDVQRISPEAPVPVFHKTAEKSMLGGAANVAANLAAADQLVSIMALVGNDKNGEIIRGILEEKGINTDLIVTSRRNTTEKIRLLASYHQQVVRIDAEDTDAISEQECELLLSKLEKTIDRYDLVLVSDYLKGLLTYELTQGVIQVSNQKKIPVIIDVKDSKIEKYKDACLLKPNLKELHDLTGMPVSSDKEIVSASEYLRKTCNCQFVLTTLGAGGMVLVGGETPYFVKSICQEVYDVTGAGDTAFAYLAACIVNHCSMEDAVKFANYAAGIQVSKVGTSCVYWNEIEHFLINGRADEYTRKIVDINSMAELRKRNPDKKIVFTNGCFDILHIGHVRYLYQASLLGDILVVGINSDSSVRRLKGSDRPINADVDRAELIAALAFIDFVVLFEQDTPYELISAVKPDILVKGGDYKSDEVVGKDIVERRGGKLVLIPYVEGKSTTGILRKISCQMDEKVWKNVQFD